MFRQLKLIRLLAKTMLSSPWVVPPDFAARSRTKLYATELDTIENNLQFLYDTMNTLMPAGLFCPYGGDNAPTGWLMCDGTGKSTTTYAALFAAIGYKYGGTGATFFVPDLRGRIVMGAGTGVGGGASGAVGTSPVGGSALAARLAGQWGGIEAIALAIANMPSHDHGDTAWRDLNHYHWVQHNHGASSDDNLVGAHSHDSTSGATNIVGTGAGPYNVNGSGSNWVTFDVGHAFRTDTAPNHHHDISTSVDNGWRNDTDWSGDNRANYPLNHHHDIPLQGSGTSFQVTQPFVVANAIIKT